MTRRTRFASALAALLAAATAAPAGWADDASEGRRLAAAFDVYWLGFRVFSGELAGEIADGRYRVASVTETRGVLDLLFDAEVRSEVAGRVSGRGFAPVRYRSASLWRANEREVRMRWHRDGTVEAERRPPPSEDDFDAGRDEVPQALRRGTRDPLTALIATVTRPLDAAPCTGTLPVFDGRRRYNLRLEYVGEDRIEPGTVPAYAGPASKCRAHFEKVAGFDTKWNAENPQPDEPTTLWLARAPEAGVWLPVRAVGQSRWGEVEAALIRHGAPENNGSEEPDATAEQ